MNLCNKVECFVSVKPFQPSLIFVGKARTYHIEEPFRCSTL